MKDFLGNEIEVGDFLFFNRTGEYPASYVGKVKRLTPRTVVVVVIKGFNESDWNVGKEARVASDRHCIRICSESFTECNVLEFNLDTNK